MSNQPTTILVTGAFGQVGKRVTAILLERGRTVIALDVRSPATELVAQGMTSSTGTLVPAFVDLLDAEAVSALLAQHQPQAIVHLAAILAPACYRIPEKARKVNVEGTENLVAAATALAEKPFFLECSSSAVYGSRNPHTHTDRLTADTPINPVDCYGEDKVTAERLVAASGLRHATLRLAGVMSPDMLGAPGKDGSLLSRAVPSDNRIHMVDARDVALAFANAVDRADTVAGKTLMIAGDETCVLRQQDMMDDLMHAMGIGRLGPSVSLPGDPGDDQGWFLTDWFDTSESQALLGFQQHSWQTILDDLAASAGRGRVFGFLVAPLLRSVMRLDAKVKRRREGRGRYADPWKLIGATYGPAALAQPGSAQ